MKAIAATVVIPTYDHGPTLRYAVQSALAQTVADLEVLVVGDGVPDVTRELMAELTAADPRVRWFDNAKARATASSTAMRRSRRPGARSSAATCARSPRP